MEQLHLDVYQDKNERICRLYWELESEDQFKYKVSEIANMFDLKANQVSNLVKKSCVAYSNTVYCIECEIAYELTVRNDYDSHNYRRIPWKCKNCLEEENNNLLMARQDKIIALIERTQTGHIEVNKLTLKQCIYLLALIRHSANEMLTGFNAVAMNRVEQLMPQPDSDGELVRFLYQSDIISLSYDSPNSAFDFEFEVIFNFMLRTDGGFNHKISSFF